MQASPAESLARRGPGPSALVRAPVAPDDGSVPISTRGARMALRVLLTEDEPHYGDAAEHELRAAGHEVVRCTEAGTPAFPCVGLIDANACPLRNGVVDVTLAMRHVPRTAPARSEDGVVCSLRHHVPVVVARDAAFDPFADWETAA